MKPFLLKEFSYSGSRLPQVEIFVSVTENESYYVNVFDVLC